MLAAVPVGAQAQTRAGTPIVNTAGLTFAAGGETRSLQSNTVTLLVAERIDVRLVRDGDGPVAPNAAVPFILTNIDNGREAFAVAASLSDGAQAPMLAVDGDGDGRYDALRDAFVVPPTTNASRNASYRPSPSPSTASMGACAPSDSDAAT
ncbi:MAG: hypothetical protein EOO77_26965, partial [Oxalobacteraceae bacterium]